MKVLKHGNCKRLPCKFECPSCHCEFVADVDEYFFWGFNPDYIITHCPECGYKCLEEDNPDENC